MPESQRAGMHAEDEIVSVNGVPFTGMAGLIRQTFHAHPGQIVSVVYRNPAGQPANRTSTADAGARRAAPNRFRLVDQHRAGCCSFLPFVFCSAIGWCWPGRSTGMPGSCPGHHECSSSLRRSCRAIFPVSLPSFTIFWQIFAFQLMLVSLILFSIYLPGPLPHRPAAPLDQVADHCSPDRRWFRPTS
jgi:hypothetical protein